MNQLKNIEDEREERNKQKEAAIKEFEEKKAKERQVQEEKLKAQQVAEEKERQEQTKKEQAVEGATDIDENKKDEIILERYVQ